MAQLRSSVAALLLLAVLSHTPAGAVKDMKLYNVLGVDPGASDETIKKAYKRMAL
jgi:DnaJ-domain-containing protein 1